MTPPMLHPNESPVAGTVFQSTDVRAAMAEAMGLCEGGERATVLLRGADLPRVIDLLQTAAARLLPLVVRVWLDDGHQGLWLAADTGAAVLLARPGEVAAVHLLARLFAERALLPVLVAAEAPAGATTVPALVPAAIDLLGDAAESMPSRTPAQELLFGNQRRRVVRWFDHERPVLRGQPADPALRLLQRASSGPFVAAPAARLLDDAAAEVQRATGVAWSRVTSVGPDKADVVVVTLPGTAASAAEALAASATRPTVAVARVSCLRPFADGWLSSLRRRRAVVVLSAADTTLAGEPPLLRELRAALLRPGQLDAKDLPPLHSALVGLGGEAANPDDLAAFVRECHAGNGRGHVYLGVDFAPKAGSLQKRVVLHEALRRAHPGIERLGLGHAAPAATRTPSPAQQRLAPPRQQEPTHDNLLRSWDLVGAAAVTGVAHELAPDPYFAAGSVPALTSLLRANRPGDELPALDPGKCTGCGACWTACPDSAWLPAAIAPAELLEAGVRLAPPAEALRPLLPRLAKGLAKATAAGARTAGMAVRAAAEPLLQKVDEGKQPAQRDAVAALAFALDSLPLAVPDVLFGRAESERPGSGHLLALALDPDACKGCGLCVASCAPAALSRTPRTRDLASTAAAGAACWRALPDTPGAVVAALRGQAEPGPLAALELSRHCLCAVAPGDDAEPGSGARIALRSVLAATEAHLQPKLRQQLADLDELAGTFAARIRDQLAGALPVGDLEALHEGLATLGQGAVALSALAARLDESTQQGRIDATRLQRLVDTARALADLRWRIHQGSTGRGRARAGLVFSGPAAQTLAEHYPWNPFAMPAVLDDSPEAGHRALGLLRGSAAAVARDFALQRRARALLQPGAPGPRELTFAELTAAERAVCPPLWLCADAGQLDDGGLRTVGAVLESGLPIKLLLLATAKVAAAPCTTALLALAHRDAFVLQTSIAHLDHIATGVQLALAHPGAALVHVLAPNPRQHGAAADQALQLAAAAVQRRAFPLLSYDPARSGAFGQKLSLAGNPDPDAAGTDDPALLATWSTLQELAGVRTPFTHEVEQRAAATVADRHAAELRALQARHQDELRSARAHVEGELLQRLHHKLVTLSRGAR